MVALTFLGWTLFAVFFALLKYIDAVYQDKATSFLRELPVWLLYGYAWTLLTPLIFYASKKFPLVRDKFWRNLFFHLLIGLFLSILQLSLFAGVAQLFLGSPSENLTFWQNVQEVFLAKLYFDLIIYAAIVGILHLRESNRRILVREREAAHLNLKTSQLETKLTQARLDALKMQLHPHFLFNTLNSISVLMRDGKTKDADEMLTRLSELLRITLKSEAKSETSLKEELNFLSSYLEIERIRFRDRLKIRFELDVQTLSAKVPSLILQPLVENAIRHGVSQKADEGKILIESKRKNGFIELSVSDNGLGFDESKFQKASGIGLENTRERLEKLYGTKQKFEISNAELLGGFQVKIQIPFSKSNENGE